MVLAHDLARVSPIVSVLTPFGSDSIKRRLRNQGFERMQDVPRGLAVGIARDRRSAAFVLGSYRVDGDTITLNASMYATESGDLIGTHSVTTDDWLAGIDDISAALLGFARVEPADNRSDDPVSEHLSGDIAAARESASRALGNSYRLSNSSRFSMKAQQYLYDGDLDKTMQVIDIWSQVEPNSTRALESKARLGSVMATDEALEAASGAFDRLLELNPDDVFVYREKAALEQQRGNYDAAAELLQQFLTEIPDNSDAHIQLSAIYQAQGRLADAQEALETASILSETTVTSEIGLARLEARRSLFDDASRRLDDLLSPNLNNQQRLEILGGKAEIIATQGKMFEAIDLLTEANELAKGLVPPALRITSIESQIGMMLGLAGETEEAIASMDAIVDQLSSRNCRRRSCPSWKWSGRRSPSGMATMAPPSGMSIVLSSCLASPFCPSR